MGKTTTTANLGVALAKQNKSVVLVDADIGLRNLDVVMGLENRIVFHLCDVVRGECSAQKALIKDRRVDNLFLRRRRRPTRKSRSRPTRCALIDVLKEAFDFVLIDCPAGIEQGFRNACAGRRGHRRGDPRGQLDPRRGPRGGPARPRKTSRRACWSTASRSRWCAAETCCRRTT